MKDSNDKQDSKLPKTNGNAKDDLKSQDNVLANSSDSGALTEEQSLIDYPCEFPVKVMGEGVPEFHACVTKIAEKHDPEFDKDETKQNSSKTGKYVSLTLNIHAKDKEQLDKLYQELTDHELVLWAL